MSEQQRPTQTCETCRFWSTDGIAGDGDVPGNSGDCRRHAPTQFMVNMPNWFKGEHMNLVGEWENAPCDDARRVWPLTYLWDWCGEWQEKHGEADPPKFTEKQISLLTSGEENVIRLRYGIGRDGTTCKPFTLKDTARILQITQERVRQIESKAVRRMAGIPPRAK